MRIQRVELRRFGHFVDTNVELDHPVGGLRFVVGPNEAGKSTLRTALRVGLFGFEGRVVAGRPAAASAVALHLANGAGDGFVLDRQGMGAPRDAGGRPIDQEALARWVVLNREAFDRLYCLGHDELRRFGMELLQSGEDLGRIALGAALGGTHVQRVGAELASEPEALYAPGARVRRLNKAIDELTTLDARLRSITVSADTWAALRGEIQETEASIASLADRNRALARETARLERIRRTANARGVLRDHRDELAQRLAEGPAPDVVTADRITALLDALEESSKAIGRHRDAIGTLETRLARTGSDRSALDRASEITALHQDLGGYRDAVALVRRIELAADASRALPNFDGLVAVLVDHAAIPSQVEALEELDADVAATRAKLDEHKKQLGLATVPDEGIAALGVPTEAEIESAREGAADRAARRKELRKALELSKRDIERAEGELVALRSAGVPLPSADEIASARSERDGSWGVLRAWFVTDRAPPDGERDRAGLAEQVQGGIATADALVDRVRADTARAAQTQAAELRLAALHDAREKQQAEVEAIDDQDGAALDAWRALWDGVDVRVGTPSEMSTWRHGWRELCQDVVAAASSIAEAGHRRSAVVEATKRLRDALDASGQVPPADAGVLAMLALAQDLVAREQQRRADEEEVASARARLREIDERLAGLLALLPEADRSPGDRAIERLHELRGRQASDYDARTALEEQIADAKLALQRELDAHERAAADAADEARALGVDADRLPEVLARAAEVAELRRKMDLRKEQLLDAGDGLGIDELQAEAEAAGDLDAVVARLAEIDRDKQELEGERTAATKHLADLEAKFRAIAGSDEAAATHEAQARALSRIADLLDEIAVLTLATSLLDRVVDGARATGRGPMIERAGHYFRLLTDAAFDGLDLEPHGEQAFPVAVRADGSRLYPTALSDGTLDQLWLAWRLAGVEHHIDQMGPVPLIVDDVLVNFDDARAGSAFRALASLAERTQVLVLTHHPHLVDIARASLGPGKVVVAQLEGRPDGALAVTQVVSAEDASGRPPLPAPTAPSTPSVRAPAQTTGSRDASVKSLRAAIDGEWRGKSELVERSGIGAGGWNAAIKALLADGSVEQQGAKRGAKYRRVGVGASVG